MAQLLRIYKLEICSAIRSYGTQRYQQNHYEVLNVSPNASQKDIRQAFIRLSKQLHPDTSGKSSHVQFIKLNEAYSVLGKKSTRRQYDIELQYGCNTHYAHGYSQNAQYASQWEYEVRTAGGPWPPPKQTPDAFFGLAVAMLFLGMGLFQLIFVYYSIKVRKLSALRNAQLEREYQHIRNVACTKSNNIHDLASIDLNEYLTRDNNVSKNLIKK